MKIINTYIVNVEHRNGGVPFLSTAKVYETADGSGGYLYFLEDQSINKHIKKITEEEFEKLSNNPI